MKRLLLSLSFALCSLFTVAQQRYVLTSPDGRNSFTFEQTSQGRLTYSLSYRGETVISPSEMGVDIDNTLFEDALGVPNDTCTVWTRNLTLVGVDTLSRDTTWSPLYGERSRVRDHYNQFTFHLMKGNPEGTAQGGYVKVRTYFLDIQVRAYDEGIAFRYCFPETTNGLFLHITADRTQFTLPEGTKAWYEQWAQGPYSLLPLSGWKGDCERPLTLMLPNGKLMALGEANLTDFVRTKFALDTTQNNTIKTQMYASADVMSPYEMPWRYIRVADDAPSLANGNDLVLNLSTPCQLEDTSWIRPGKAFRVGLTQKEALAGIDFASQMGLQYIELDARWYGPEFKMESDASRVDSTKDLDIRAICDYGRQRGIGVILYVNQRALSKQLDEILPIYREWGVSGLKFGFVQVGNQLWTKWLHEAVRQCARYHMVVDIHDEYRPTGFSRTYPNLLNQEGVRGNEEMPDAKHNTILPFTRFLAGSADYTPCYFSKRVKNTHAHQLAMAVVYYAPLEFLYWYDSPRDYQGEPELDFWRQVPTTWDDSQVLCGEVGEYVATARRSGSQWFVGVMNGLEARTLSLPTDFLQKGKKYTATLYEDDPSLDTRTHVSIRTIQFRAGKPLSLTLQASGGVAMIINKEG